MIKKMAQRGFTLIELLVVIAIIGILAGVVLTSLGSARSSAADSKIKSQLSSIRAEAEIYATSNGNSYHVGTTNNVCTYAPITGLRTINGVAGTCNAPSGGASWSVHFPLSVSGRSWCVDHTGASREVGTPSAAIVTCPTT